MRSPSHRTGILLACLVAAGGGGAAVTATAASPVRNAIEIEAPTAKIRVGREFVPQVSAQFDRRTHRPPREYLKAALYLRPGTRTCPSQLPYESKVWEEIAHVDYDPESSAHIGFDAHITLTHVGSHRFCAYVYVERPGPRFDSPSTFLVKARASRVMRAR